MGHALCVRRNLDDSYLGLYGQVVCFDWLAGDC